MPVLAIHEDDGDLTHSGIQAGAAVHGYKQKRITFDLQVQDAGFFDRLLSSAESLVTVRPIGSVAGDGVPEKVARMEVALKAGDLGAAIAEFDTLPEEAKAAGAAFGDKIRARLEVERLVDQAIATAMKA